MSKNWFALITSEVLQRTGAPSRDPLVTSTRTPLDPPGVDLTDPHLPPQQFPSAGSADVYALAERQRRN
jgi:hypothetical protein